MSDTPKFTVVDRRKFRADEESTQNSELEAASKPSLTPETASKPDSGPRLKLVESIQQSAAKPEPVQPAVAVEEEIDGLDDSQLPPAPSAEESLFQRTAYNQAAERLDDLVRAQNPGAPAPEKIGFEHLIQQLYLSAMMQMGAGTPEGQRPRIDILGARQTIDLLGVVEEKTKGNLTPDEDRAIQTVLFELRMTFLELTRMISAQPPMPPPPGGAKR
jgi:hypothetical protein